MTSPTPAQISYDLVMSDDMDFVEGTFQLGDEGWSVFIGSKRVGCNAVVLKPACWESGVVGVVITVPPVQTLGKSAVEALLGEYYGVDDWQEVSGPDSMQLR